MAFRYRKSIKVMPGVRLNVSSRGLGYSVGVPGYRVTKSASGRVSQTVSIPGTGLRSTKTLSSGARSRSSSPSSYQVQSPAAPTPGLFATSEERALHRARQKGDKETLAKLASEESKATIAASILAALAAVEDHAYEVALNFLMKVWQGPSSIDSDELFSKYLAPSVLTVGIAEGVTGDLPMSGDAVGLLLAELLQSQTRLAEAIQVVESLDATQPAALSLADLYAAAGRWNDVVDISNGVVNSDDQSALLLVFRASAFLQLGQTTAARECLKEALKSKKRLPAVRHQGLIVRALSYVADGKPRLARTDLERLTAENPDYPGLSALMDTVEAAEAGRPKSKSDPSSQRSETSAAQEVDAQWAPDPTKRHELRYWDGAAWTEFVADNGVQSEDPL